MDLTNNTKQILKSIENITHHILDNYEKLNNLEDNNLKDTKEYQEILNILINDINITNSLYLTLGNNTLELESILHYLNCYKVLKYPIDDFEVILDNKDLVNYRMCKIIGDKFLKCPKVYLKEFYSLGPNAYKIFTACSNDILMTFLTIMNKYLNDDNIIKDLKSYLRNIKYKLAFLNPFIEDDLINNNFNINSPIRWNAKIYGSLYNISEEDVIHTRRVVNDDLYITSIEFLFDDTCDTSIYQNEYLLMSILLRSSILFYDEDNLNNAIKNVYVRPYWLSFQ